MIVSITHKGVTREIEFDETLKYADFYLDDGKPGFDIYDMPTLLTKLGAPPLDQDWPEFFQYLARWVRDAPRKRFYREMKLKGYTVLSGEFFFEDQEDGEERIDWLENSGKLAVRVLEAFDLKIE